VDRVLAALDVGGTSMKGALVDARFGVVREVRRPTPRDLGPDAVVQAIMDQLAELIAMADERPIGAGVVVPGIVDDQRGVAVASANLGWQDVPLRQMLQQHTGLPVALGHDVRAGALAESRLGAAQGATDVLFLPLGFGIACAVIVDGHMLVAGGYAGELGHIVVEPDGEPCGCGRRGCLETVASAASIGRRYARDTGRAAATSAEVAALVLAGDAAAGRVWDAAVAGLADALELATMLVAPQLVVIGGGLSMAGELLLVPLRAALAGRMRMQRQPSIVSAALGDRAGYLGAAILASDALLARSRDPGLGPPGG
jgi:glucokinase